MKDSALTELARILVFMAKCDGHYHQLESDMLADVLERYVARFGGTVATAEAAIASSRKLAPDGSDLVRAIERFSRAANGRQLCRFVLDAGAAMIGADGRIAAEEVHWGIELCTTLKAIVDR